MSTIAKNAGYLLVAQLLSKGVSFLYTLFLAPRLGPENFGLFIVALSYFSLLSSLAEFGVNRFIVREVALNKTKTGPLLCSVLLFRLCLITVAYALFASVLTRFDLNTDRVGLSLLAALAIIPQSMAFSLDSILIGRERFLKSALGLVTLSLITSGLGVYFTLHGEGTYGVVAALVLGQIAYVFALTIFSLNQGWQFIKQADKVKAITTQLLKEVTKGSLPYGILGILGLIYFRVDSILLSYLKGSYEVGLYGLAYRFLEAIVFVPSAVATAMFPVLVRFHQTNIREIKILYYKSLTTLLLISLLIMVGYLFILPWVIRIYFPAYINSITALQILSLAIPFIFIHVPGTIVLLSTDKYLKPVIYLSLLTVGFNILANLGLIPGFGLLGASVVTVLSEALSFIVFFILLKIKIL